MSFFLLGPAASSTSTADEGGPLASEIMSRTVHAGRWPKTPTEAAVRKAFPTAKGILLPKDREPFAGDALVVFASVDAAKKAVQEGAEAGGKPLRLTWAGVVSLPI